MANTNLPTSESFTIVHEIAKKRFGPNPMDWDKKERELECRARLKPGARELDIEGIQGVPGHPGYLDFLYGAQEKPLGCGTNMVSKRVDRCIAKIAYTETQEEIERYEDILCELLNSPIAIRTYIGVLEKQLESVEKRLEDNYTKITLYQTVAEIQTEIEYYSWMLRILTARE